MNLASESRKSEQKNQQGKLNLTGVLVYKTDKPSKIYELLVTLIPNMTR